MQEYQPRMLSTYALTLFRHNATMRGEAVPVRADFAGHYAVPCIAPTPVSIPCQVDFWDTAGQERFNSMHPAYYHQAHACVLCFDVTRKQTYKNMPQWIQELREYRPKIPTICIANKVDVDMKVMGKEFAFPKKHNIPLYFCSAADGTNVVAAFEEILEKAYDYAHSDAGDDFVDTIMGLLRDQPTSLALYKESADGKDEADQLGNPAKPAHDPTKHEGFDPRPLSERD